MLKLMATNSRSPSKI